MCQLYFFGPFIWIKIHLLIDFSSATIFIILTSTVLLVSIESKVQLNLMYLKNVKSDNLPYVFIPKSVNWKSSTNVKLQLNELGGWLTQLNL